MSPQAPQINAAQLEKACQNLERRIAAKTLECASLDQMRQMAAPFVKAITDAADVSSTEDWPDAAGATAENYLTALLNQERVTLEEWDIQLRGFKSMLQQMQSNILLPTGMKV